MGDEALLDLGAVLPLQRLLSEGEQGRIDVLRQLPPSIATGIERLRRDQIRFDQRQTLSTATNQFSRQGLRRQQWCGERNSGKK